MRIVIANDQAAVALKMELQAWLKSQGHEVVNLGVDVEDRVDYPDMAAATCAEYKKGGYDFGMVMCGTGIGVSIAANKIKGIRCALIHDSYTARMAREHNDANFIAMGGRVEYAQPPAEILASFIDAKFQGGRHTGRVAKLGELDDC
jgi:ribose 5-phosphate isomerase B